MNKQELIDELSKMTDLTKTDCNKLIDSLKAVITKTVKKGKKVTLVDFGTFELVKRKARKGRNPQTGEEIKIAASNNVKFKAGSGLKKAVN